MKYNVNNIHVVELGNGDEDLIVGYSEENNAVGALSFTSIEPRAIGSYREGFEEGETDEAMGAHTRIVFKNTASIHVMIERLYAIEKIMNQTGK